MKYKLFLTSNFKKDVKKLSSSEKLDVIKIIDRLLVDDELETKYHDHALSGKLKGYRDCHVHPDLVLIYKKDVNLLILSAYRIGSHSELFGK